MVIKFTKMQGLGNDYIYVNTKEYKIENPSELAIKWSKYHTGVGSDGLVLIGESNVADFSMRIFNADGSEAMMCGNASRCIGKYVYDKHLTDKTEITLETLSGIKTISLQSGSNAIQNVTVDMNEPLFSNPEQFVILGGNLDETEVKTRNGIYLGTFVCMGNPHFVVFVDNVMDVNLEYVGPELECNPVFPQKTNVEFAQVIDENNVRMRVWERGTGMTQACGTGACATAVATIKRLQGKREVDIHMDGGTLHIKWDEVNNHIYMTGPAVNVFEGTIEIE